MLHEGGHSTFNEWSDLDRCIARAEMAIEQHRSDMETIAYMQKRKIELASSREKLTKTINRCTEIYKDIKQNLVEKKRVALEDYRVAIKESKEIVADCDVNDMDLLIDGNRAVIINDRGHDLNEREGSANRSTVGLLMRYISLVKQPVYSIPMMFFDETFFTLSDNTCVEMRRYLKEISRYMLIIAIEQKDSLFNDINDKVVYTFVKGVDGKTKIRLEEQI